jgi:uncharacterized cupin superfamily protein
MNVTRFADAPEYSAPNHFDMRCLRLQGHEAGPAEQLWLGASVIEPGGHIVHSASDREKHYVVLEGEVVLTTPDAEARLRQFDSCRLAAGEGRAIRNAGDRVAIVLLAMPLQPMPAL